MDPRLPIAVALAAFAGAMWFGFVRRTPERTATGIITAKQFKPAGSYTQVPTGTDRAFRTPTNIPIAAAYIFNIQLDTPAETAAVALNEVLSRQFETGQRVRVRYTVKGIGPIGRRLMVLELSPQ
jgi:hypothetical protein